MKKFVVNEIVESNGVIQGLVHKESYVIKNIGVMYDDYPTDDLIDMFKKESPFFVVRKFCKYMALISCDEDGLRMNLIQFRNKEDGLEKFPLLRKWPAEIILNYERVIHEIFSSESEDCDLFLAS